MRRRGSSDCRLRCVDGVVESADTDATLIDVDDTVFGTMQSLGVVVAIDSGCDGDGVVD